MASESQKKRKRQKDEPVSLSPLDPKEALADLMKIGPERSENDRPPRHTEPEDGGEERASG